MQRFLTAGHGGLTQWLWSDAPSHRHTSAYTLFLLRCARCASPCAASLGTRQAARRLVLPPLWARAAAEGAGRELLGFMNVPLMCAVSLELLEMTCTRRSALSDGEFRALCLLAL